MSICNAQDESGLQILIPNAAGLQIRQSGKQAFLLHFARFFVTLNKLLQLGIKNK
jgi:hypothetical protein